MTSGAWSGRMIAIVGGDRREQQIALGVVATGASVRAFGFPIPEGGLPGVALAESPLAAAKGADVLILPLPAMTGNRVFAPSAAAPVVVGPDCLSAVRAGGLVVAGSGDEAFLSQLREIGLAFAGYEHDEASRIARAPAIAEGALARIIQETDFTLNGATVALMGYGVVGRQLAGALRSLGARTTVIARNHAQRVAAQAAGHESVEDAMRWRRLGEADILVNTASALTVDETVLEALRDDCLVVDLASPPGGVDLASATRLGRRVVWARGLGATAWVTLGQSQWASIACLIEAHFTQG